MHRLWIILIVTLWVMMASGLTTLAQVDDSPGRDLEFEQAVYDRLATIDPNAVPLFRQATSALDAGDLQAAKVVFEQVLEMAPDFPDALRRLSYIESELNNNEIALQLARRAYDIDDSPYNQAALAVAMLQSGDEKLAVEALQLARTAVEALPDDGYAISVLLFASIINEDSAVIRQTSHTLVELVPESPFGHFWLGLSLAEEGAWEQSEEELLLAQKLGWPAEEVQGVLADGISREANNQRLIRAGLAALIVWAVGLIALFVAGIILSFLTLTAVRRARTSATFSIGSGERLVRNIYRAVIALTSVYYYLSLPMMVVLVIGVVLGIFYLFLVAGRIPLRLAAFILIAGVVTLYSIARSILIRTRQEEPGDPLPRQDAPGLWQLTEAVAERVTIRPIDAIYIVPGTSIGVIERGSILKKLRGEGQRYLILGLGSLPGMTQGQFKAILAHEYGHFSNRDTAGGNLALQVRVSMVELARNLAMNGQARWYNPVWLFLNAFNRIFLRTTLGASRLQEILADRYATVSYGTHNFIDGLTHIVYQSLAFEMQVNEEIQDALQHKRETHNLYTLPPLEADTEQKVATAFQEVMKRPTSAYDSHPALQDRIKLVQQIETSAGEEELEPVWDLLPDSDALQKKMTNTIYDNVLQQQRLLAQLKQER